jgi:hypothetical protein
MIILNGKKVTANYFAKYMVADKGERANYWSDNRDYSEELKKITQREADEIDRLILKHIDRVRNFLGVDEE